MASDINASEGGPEYRGNTRLTDKETLAENLGKRDDVARPMEGETIGATTGERAQEKRARQEQEGKLGQENQTESQDR